MRGLSFGQTALLAGVGIAALGILLFQDWWAIAFAIGGVVVTLLAGRGKSPERSLIAGLEIGGSILLVVTGVFLLVLGLLSAPARPCDGCSSSGLGFVVIGAVALALGGVLAFLGVREARGPSPH